jgi:hypothetical protein
MSNSYEKGFGILPIRITGNLFPFIFFLGSFAKPGFHGRAQQMAYRENQFVKAEGVGGMNVAHHGFVVHRPVDDVGAFPPGRAEDGRLPQQVTPVAEGVGGHALFFAEIFVRVVGIQGIDAHFEFLAVAQGMQPFGQAAHQVR